MREGNRGNRDVLHFCPLVIFAHLLNRAVVGFAFKTGKGTEATVEGKRFDIRYTTTAGNTAPSPLAIIRNHQQAIAKIGGTMQYEDQRYTILKVASEGKVRLLLAGREWRCHGI
jgi:hypothetical protein